MEYREECGEGAQPRYVRRGIAGAVATTSAPVALLEGAHGVGKTALALSEAAFERFHYVTLADPAQLAQASADPDGWLASLPRPAVIDDAHRIDSLVDAARQAARKRRGKRPSFVLMSPVRLRWQGDRGPRPACFTLFPLTQAELAERQGCVVDDLFDATVARGFRSSHTRSDLRAMMRAGGFPGRALGLEDALAHAEGRDGNLPFQGQLDLMRSEGAEPGTSVDDLVDRSVLRAVLHQPGIALGADALAQACHVDASTLSSHLEAMRDGFLVHRLAMLDKRRSHERPFAGTRIHPMDTSLAVEGLRHAGHDIAVEPPAFSKALKTLCVNQLAATAQWAREPTECLHWRRFDRRMREVDLVLEREGRIVGITVRNSLAANPSSIGALAHLAEDERFARGFIVYMGPFHRRLSENIWAIPVSALWEQAAFCAEGAAEDGMPADGLGPFSPSARQGSQRPQGT